MKIIGMLLMMIGIYFTATINLGFFVFVIIGSVLLALPTSKLIKKN